MRLANLVKGTNREMSNTVLAQTVINNTYSICGKRIASVPVELMDIDYTYQRIAGTTINKLMRDWNDEKCDFLVVSFRDNKFYIIDGQHRYTVAKAKGIVSLPCIIFTGLTQNDEALKFARQQDNVNKLSAYDTFKANIACGNTNVLQVRMDMEIKRICDKYNIEVKKYGKMNVGEKVLRCLANVRKIVNSTSYDGVKCFEWAVDMINATNWADCSDAYTESIIGMLRTYYVDNAEHLREGNILKIMNSITPSELIVKAKYEYSEYGVGTALTLCLRDMIQEVNTSNTNYGIRVA